MHNHWLFFWNFFSHWVVGMSGPIAVGFSIWEYVRGKRTEGWVFFVVGMLLIVAACDLAWQDEHRNSQLLIEQKSIATGEANFWKGQSYQKDESIRKQDESIRKRDELLTQNFTVIGNTQQALVGISAKVLDITKPGKQRTLDFDLSQSLRNVDRGAARYSGSIILLTNQTVTPIKLLVECKGTIVRADGIVMGTTGMMTGGWGGQPSPTSFRIGILSPAWTPDDPMFVTIYCNDLNAGPCTFSQQ